MLDQIQKISHVLHYLGLVQVLEQGGILAAVKEAVFLVNDDDESYGLWWHEISIFESHVSKKGQLGSILFAKSVQHGTL